MQHPTKVGFYLLQRPCADGRLRVACRLTETAFQRGHRVYIHTSDPAMTDAMDRLLWTFAERSFVPHATTKTHDVNHGDAPVVIDSADPGEEFDDVLVPLLKDIPPYYTRFHRVMEAVDTEDVEKQTARERYKQYREHGTEPETHKINP